MDKWLQKKMEKLLRKDKEEEEEEAEVVEEEVEEEEEKVMMDIEERIEDLTQPNHVMETVNLMISRKLEHRRIREEEAIEVEDLEEAIEIEEVKAAAEEAEDLEIEVIEVVSKEEEVVKSQLKMEMKASLLRKLKLLNESKTKSISCFKLMQ
jgi:hypothetical protein